MREAETATRPLYRRMLALPRGFPKPLPCPFRRLAPAPARWGHAKIHAFHHRGVGRPSRPRRPRRLRRLLRPGSARLDRRSGRGPDPDPTTRHPRHASRQGPPPPSSRPRRRCRPGRRRDHPRVGGRPRLRRPDEIERWGLEQRIVERVSPPGAAPAAAAAVAPCVRTRSSGGGSHSGSSGGSGRRRTAARPAPRRRAPVRTHSSGGGTTRRAGGGEHEHEREHGDD